MTGRGAAPEPKEMPMKITFPILTPLVLAAGLTAAPAAGGPMGPPPHNGHGSGPPLERAIQSLDLTGAQEDAIGELLDARRAEMEARRDQAIAAHQALHGAVLAEPFDEGAIRNAAAAVAALISDRALAEARLLNDVRALLTQDQREQLEESLARMPERFHGPPPGGGPRRGGRRRG
jgi:Spy/CpxP family protein refolding chaperone